MSAKIEYKDKEIRVYLSGEIDHHSASLIRASIDDTIIHKHPSLLILDFGNVSFMDSSGIGLVMGRYKLMKNLCGFVIIDNAPAAIKKVMRMAGIEKMLSAENRKEGSAL